MKEQSFPIRKKLEFRLLVILPAYVIAGIIILMLYQVIFPALKIQLWNGYTGGWMSYISFISALVCLAFFAIIGENRGIIWMK